MSGVIISISWEYFLGVMGALIAVAYYTNGRLSGLETSVQWLRDAIRELALRAENITHKVFANSSPVALTQTGEQVLCSSG